MKSYTVQFEIAGPTAMWTRPDTGDAPVSYPAPTFSAAKGMFESICWLKSANVTPVKVEICAPLIFHTYSTNYGGPLRKSKIMKKGSSFQLLATVLTNVIYRLYAEVDTVDPSLRHLSEEAKQSVTLSRNGAHAYRAIFERRLTRGQWYSVPCLGWREFTPSYVGPFRCNTKVCPINTVTASMLHAVFSKPKYGIYRPMFRQNVVIENGVLIYA
jgi:CRISPR-associated protein Cas5d